MKEGLVVIGLTGPSRSGKDSAGKILSALYGFHRIALADAMKSSFDDLSGPSRDMHKDLSDDFSQRRAWQLLGTESRIEIGEPSLWTGVALAKIHYATFNHPRPIRRFVIPDVSYPDEIDGLRHCIAGMWGGWYETWSVERPGLGPIREAHSSEVSRRLLSGDRTISNGGTLANLQTNISCELESIGIC